MAASAPIDELRHRYAAQPRRFLAPLANALRQSGALEEAVTMLRAQLAVYPDHLTGHVVLGQALFDTGALAESRGAFERAWELDPGNRVVLRHLGEIASMAGDGPAARVWFGRLRTADPYADDVAAQLAGGAIAPPGADEDAAAHAAVDAAAEVHEPPAAAEAQGARDDSFELLDYEPVANLEADASGGPGRDVLDPVVGLDLAPEALGPELVASGLGEKDEGSTSAASGAPDDLEHLVAGPFATETMAGLLASQGHTEQAVALYARLAAERPDDAGLRERLDALRGRRAAGAPEAMHAAGGEPAPGSDDVARGALLAAAFRDLPAAAPADAFDATFADVSFDQFFPADDAAPAAVAAAPASDEDLARFDAWLRGDEA